MSMVKNVAHFYIVLVLIGKQLQNVTKLGMETCAQQSYFVLFYAQISQCVFFTKCLSLKILVFILNVCTILQLLVSIIYILVAKKIHVTAGRTNAIISFAIKIKCRFFII